MKTSYYVKHASETISSLPPRKCSVHEVETGSDEKEQCQIDDGEEIKTNDHDATKSDAISSRQDCQRKASDIR